MDDASPALPGIAPHMRPGQPQRLAQELDQEGSVFDLPRHGTPVDLDVDLSHLAPSPFLVHEYIERSRLGKERRWRAAPVARTTPVATPARDSMWPQSALHFPPGHNLYAPHSCIASGVAKSSCPPPSMIARGYYSLSGSPAAADKGVPHGPSRRSSPRTGDRPGY